MRFLLVKIIKNENKTNRIGVGSKKPPSGSEILKNRFTCTKKEPSLTSAFTVVLKRRSFPQLLGGGAYVRLSLWFGGSGSLLRLINEKLQLDITTDLILSTHRKWHIFQCLVRETWPFLLISGRIISPIEWSLNTERKFWVKRYLRLFPFFLPSAILLQPSQTLKPTS